MATIPDPKPFDSNTSMITIRQMLINMIGSQLSTIPTQTGSEPAVIIGPVGSDGPEPDLPYLMIAYDGSDDGNGFLIDSGLVTATIDDPDNVGQTIESEVPYYDTFLNFYVILRCEGDEALNILKEIRRKLRVDYYKDYLLETDGIVVDQITTIRRTPDLLSTAYRDVGTMRLALHTIDRYIDLDNPYYFDTIDSNGEYKRSTDDSSPIISNIHVTSQV
jgi:hypothetical protein